MIKLYVRRHFTKGEKELGNKTDSAYKNRFRWKIRHTASKRTLLSSWGENSVRAGICKAWERKRTRRVLSYLAYMAVFRKPSASSLTVRPPRLGGNKRVGVFASRSPFRPNGLGLSCVRLKSIEYSSSGEPCDKCFRSRFCVTKRPIFDIKPYVPLSDCVPDALEGYTKMTKEHIFIGSYSRGESPAASGK